MYAKELNDLVNSLELYSEYSYTVINDYIIDGKLDYKNFIDTTNYLLENNKCLVSLGNVNGFIIIDKTILDRNKVIIKLYVSDNNVGRVVGKNGTNLKLIIDEMKKTLNTDKEIILKVYSKDKRDNVDIEHFIKNLPNNKHRIVYNIGIDSIELIKKSDELIGFDLLGNFITLNLYNDKHSTFPIEYDRITKIYEMTEVYNNIDKAI